MRVTGLTSQQGKTTKILMGVELTSGKCIISRAIWLSCPGGGGGTTMPVGNFELDPYRRPIWAWPKLFLTPKRDEKIYISNIYFYVFSRATLIKRDLHG